jgi:hypothetical protein
MFPSVVSHNIGKGEFVRIARSLENPKILTGTLHEGDGPAHSVISFHTNHLGKETEDTSLWQYMLPDDSYFQKLKQLLLDRARELRMIS